MTRKTTLIGAAVGLAIFLPFALLPSMLYGGYAGVLLAGLVQGTPIAAGLVSRALIVVGMVVGVTTVAAVFALGGAAAGAAVGTLVRTTTPAKLAARGQEAVVSK